MVHDPLFNADEAREQREEQQRAIALQLADDLRLVMSQQGGRRFVWRYLDRAGLWRSSFTGDREGTDFREGMRNVALMLWADLQKACPEYLLRMQEENR
jgi:hypothetical protein